MDWYPWYFIKYKQDTMHLDPYQDGCYRRLIDHYMTTRAPLPDNDAALARIVGDSLANWVANGGVIVRAFFQSKNGLLFHKKCDETIRDQNNRLSVFSKAGKKGADKRWNKNNKIDSHPIPTPNTPLMGFDSTIQYNTDISTSVDILPPTPLPDWLPAEAWKKYCKHRGSKFTHNAKDLAIKKLEKWHNAGHDVKEILENSIMNGWKGLFEPKEKKNETNHSTYGRRDKSSQAKDVVARAIGETIFTDEIRSRGEKTGR